MEDGGLVPTKQEFFDDLSGPITSEKVGVEFDFQSNTESKGFISSGRRIFLFVWQGDGVFDELHDGFKEPGYSKSTLEAGDSEREQSTTP
jgi:hypothetical protein